MDSPDDADGDGARVYGLQKNEFVKHILIDSPTFIRRAIGHKTGDAGHFGPSFARLIRMNSIQIKAGKWTR